MKRPSARMVMGAGAALSIIAHGAALNASINQPAKPTRMGAAIQDSAVERDRRAAERALELMCKRASSRTAFGKTVAQQTVTQERIAEARCKIDMARLLTLKAAWMMDVAGNKVARTEIAMIKVVAPSMACQVIDWAMQAHGGGGMCDDFPLAYAYAGARTLRFADGPDEVHRRAIAKAELGRHGTA